MFRRTALMGSTVAMLVVGCSDDKATTPTESSGSGLTGSWQVTSARVADPTRGGSQFLTPEYLIFGADNTFVFLRAGDGGFRDVHEGVFLRSGGQVDLGDEIFNFAISGDQLTLSNPARTITATLDPTAPTRDDWIQPVNVLAAVASPFNEDSDLAWNGTTLWLGNGRESDEIYEFDPDDLSVLSMLPTPLEGWAIEWHGTELWVSHNGSASIFRLNTTTGASEFTSTQMGAWIQGIASDGTHMWCFSNNESTIYEYDPATNTVVSTIEFDTFIGPEGMAFVDGFLYIAARDVVHKCEILPFDVVDAFGLAGRRIVGVTHDGTSFWVHSLDEGFGDPMIQKVDF